VPLRLIPATEAGLFDQTEAFGPEQVAALVVFLAGDSAADVTGRDFIVSGGTVSLLAPPDGVAGDRVRGRSNGDSIRAVARASLIIGHYFVERLGQVDGKCHIGRE